MSTLDRGTEQNHDDAVAELRSELAEFSHDGLVQLLEDLDDGDVIRGSWGGCVISYRRGAAGSARRDRLGRARNAFTILWDNGWITDEEVRAAVTEEMGRRALPPIAPIEDVIPGLSQGQATSGSR